MFDRIAVAFSFVFALLSLAAVPQSARAHEGHHAGHGAAPVTVERAQPARAGVAVTSRQERSAGVSSSSPCPAGGGSPCCCGRGSLVTPSQLKPPPAAAAAPALDRARAEAAAPILARAYLPPAHALALIHQTGPRAPPVLL